MDIRFHALLYVSGDDSKGESPNMRRMTSVDRRIAVYLKLASRLADGLQRHFGCRLLLLTNRAEYLERIIYRLNGQQKEFCSSVDIVEIPFGEGLPADARFHSATNKIFVLEYFSQQPGYHFLLDLDIVCQCPFSEDVMRRIKTNSPLVYDISAQVFPAYGYQRIAEDLQKFCSGAMEFRWYGGEFIAGPQDFFARLSDILRPMISRYGQCWKSLHHQGDEIIVSSALNLLRQRSDYPDICDVAPLDVIRRHWGIPTDHDEQTFRQSQKVSLAHLPAMKDLLASRISDQSVMGLMRFLNRYPPVITKYFRAGLSLLD